jgi:hypothetical protein
MTASKSSVTFASICSEPLTPEEIVHVVARLRECGARVLNRKGEDLTQRDVEDLLKEIL